MKELATFKQVMYSGVTDLNMIIIVLEQTMKEVLPVGTKVWVMIGNKKLLVTVTEHGKDLNAHKFYADLGHGREPILLSFKDILDNQKQIYTP